MDQAYSQHGLSGKTVIVSGRGLGLTIAQGFAAAGAKVALVGRTAETLDAAVETIRADGGVAHAFPTDVANEESIAAMCSGVLTLWGKIDVLVNNAGINPWYKRPEHTELSEWQQIIDVNLTGVFLACKHAGRAMIAAGDGAIINITSVGGRVALARTTAYCAAKGGVEMLTKQLAFDWATKGIRVNAVAPGYIETDMTQAFLKHPERGEQVIGRTPMGRLGKPDELIGACLFLASPAASYITGQSLGVDGGWTAA
jgi:NAD(P)-dependent dehydrogenase (short-subunit alcohol dehydrogenase family)